MAAPRNLWYTDVDAICGILMFDAICAMLMLTQSVVYGYGRNGSGGNPCRETQYNKNTGGLQP